jgi:hypothetical protein
MRTPQSAVRRQKKTAGQRILYTIGHSTRSTREFVELLRAHRVEQVVDIRTVPRSRHNPQFNRPALSRSLHAVKIGYRHLKTLGGLRHARPDSLNLGWRNASFRGYADYMQTDGFAAGLARLEQIATRRPTAIMCAEAVPWRCHRSLVADALVVARWQVLHILGRQTPQPHEHTPFLRVRSGKPVYPAPEAESPEARARVEVRNKHRATLVLQRSATHDRHARDSGTLDTARPERLDEQTRETRPGRAS